MADKKTTKKKKEVTPKIESVDVKDVKVTENEENVYVEINAQVNTALESVDTTITLDETPDKSEEILVEKPADEVYVPEVDPEIEKDVEAMAEANQELEDSQEQLSKSLSEAKSQEEAKEIVEKEIKKVEDLKDKTKKIIKKYSNMQISNTWNGMIQDW